METFDELAINRQRSDIRERLNPFQTRVDSWSAAFGSKDSILIEGHEHNWRTGEHVTAVGSRNGWAIVAGEPKHPYFNPEDRSLWADAKDKHAQMIGGLREPTLYRIQEQRAEKLKSYRRPVKFQSGKLNDVRFRVLQKWEGVVTAVEEGMLFAKLKDLIYDNPDEEVELALEEVPPDDQYLVRPGSSFYWSIGYLQQSHGQIIRASQIRFRRVPNWSELDVSAAKKQVESDGRFFNFDCGNPGTGTERG